MLDLVLGGELFGLIYPDGGRKERDSPAWMHSQLYKSFGVEDEEPRKGVAGLGVRKALFYSAGKSGLYWYPSFPSLSSSLISPGRIFHTGIIDAFAYLHNRRIVYRDLKPENVMLNSFGYCVVVDFGFAKVVVDKTYTMCG